MPSTHPITAERIEVTQRELVIHVQGAILRLPWDRCSPRLAQASASQRMDAKLSRSGYGIHWPSLDEDLSVTGLVRLAKAG